MIPVKGYAASKAGAPLEPFAFQRRDPGVNDVLIDILYCGICHSDIHSARDEWGEGAYPLVPGHEMVGRVRAVGSKVKRFRVGENVGVGCYVDTCRRCPACQKGLEVYCEKRVVFCYGDTENDGVARTQGGYSSQITVDQRYVLKIPKGAPLERMAPLLCAGITTYSPLRQWKVSRGHKIAVVGLGGLGHMAVKLARSLGAEVTVLSTSPSKEADAKRLGAKHFLLTGQTGQRAKQANAFDFVLDTVSAPHDIDAELELLKTDGTLILVGASPSPLSFKPFSLILRRRRLAGSLIGGLPETQEMLNYCARKKIYSDVEVIPVTKINEAYDRVVRGDVRYRFVIDLSTL